MSMMLDWKIVIELEGKWTEQAIHDLNTAMNGWWWAWCEYADFFDTATFSKSGDVIELDGNSDGIRFDELVDFSANGDSEELIDGGWIPLEKRIDFDKAVHQRLLDSMKSEGTAIKFSVDEEYEGEPDEWYTNYYKVTSDGSRFAVKEDFGPGEYDVSGKLCGDWSKEAIQMLNEVMDYMEESEDGGLYYKMRAIHFAEAEKETVPVNMGEGMAWLDNFGSTIQDAISDSGASGLPAYETLVSEMKEKNLRGLFRVSNGQYVWSYEMYSDGESILFSERSKEEK